MIERHPAISIIRGVLELCAARDARPRTISDSSVKSWSSDIYQVQKDPQTNARPTEYADHYHRRDPERGV